MHILEVTAAVAVSAEADANASVALKANQPSPHLKRRFFTLSFPPPPLLPACVFRFPVLHIPG